MPVLNRAQVPGPPPELDEAGVQGLAVPGAPASVCSVRPREQCQRYTHSLLCSGAREKEWVGGSSPGNQEQGDWSRQGPQVLDGSLGQLQRPNDL